MNRLPHCELAFAERKGPMSETNRPALILGIHGLANKPPLDEKMRWWKSAIVEGLSRNCGCSPGDARFEFVYWADLRYDHPLAEDENREPYYPDPGTGPFPDAGQAEDQPVNAVLGAVYRGIDWIETKTGVTAVDDLILEHRFDDLWHYHSETEFARKVRGRFCDRIKQFGDHRILLVAHSMGSIIAYDCLRLLERDAPSLRVDHFVTLGSPLGLAEVKLKIGAENGSVRVPNNVARWTNLTDKQDAAALVGALSEDYAPNDYGIGVVDGPVLNTYLRPNGEANHHKSYGYLRTPEFSRIAQVFTAQAFAQGA